MYYRLRNSDESIENYKKNLVFEAIEWLQNHNEDISFVFLTDMNEVVTPSKKYHFQIVSINEYVATLTGNITLLDKLHDSSSSDNNKNFNFLYEEHLSLYNVQAQIKNGHLFKGKFRTSPYNYLEASVTITLNNEEVTVKIQGRENINRAVNEDVVAIKLLPKSEWKLKPESVLDEDNIDEDDNKAKITEENESEQVSERPVGKVVSIIKRNWRSYCGVIREKTNASMTSSNFFFIPVDKRIPFIRIETRQYDKLKGMKILVNIDCWPRDSKYPKGHYTRIIGEASNRQTETNVLLLEHDVPHMEFSVQVLNCLPKEGENWIPKLEDLSNRMDLRQEVVCSVDPPGCTDIDDALHCKDLGNDIYEVGVHIADVSHFIKPGTSLDKEAAERGTTVYLADRRIDMVPGIILFDCLIGINYLSVRIVEFRFMFVTE